MDATSIAPAAAPAPAAEPSPVVQLTERAVSQVKEVMKAQGFEGFVLSIKVVPAGCSGFGYDLNLFKEAKEGDLTWVQDGVTVATDALSSQYLQGTVVDYVVQEHGAGFKFINPNAKSSCGCGSSFST